MNRARRPTIVLVVVGLLSSLAPPCLAGQDSPRRLHFETLGFSIQPLEEAPQGRPYQALLMFLPASEGFSPSINVQIQPFAGTIAEYDQLSKRQFEAVGWTVASEKSTPESMTWDFSGEQQGRDLHFYAKAVASGGSVYLVTATALASQWDRVGAQLKDCVDSFELDGR